ncbi:hypothetical protein CERSUDRAFT_114638 [Gelatoporia subvermispora B]|uniref:Uncharacterized protein n=1 Tax=Ceriporiopsis subvermispora (strain B) TaxID=914234 RepID=M2PK76_CERS8|nr:hypothetical protein CERSUDRAFT_114638 [Gelatoporia subvermispora B]
MVRTRSLSTFGADKSSFRSILVRLATNFPRPGSRTRAILVAVLRPSISASVLEWVAALAHLDVRGDQPLWDVVLPGEHDSLDRIESWAVRL